MKEKTKMKITDVRVYPVNNKNLLANASVTFDKSLVIWVKLCESKSGHFISFPCHSYENNKGEVEWKDDCFPLSKEFREEITDAVYNEYQDVIDAEDEKKSKRTRKR